MKVYLIGTVGLILLFLVFGYICQPAHPLTLEQKINNACASDPNPQDCQFRELLRVNVEREHSRQADEDAHVN